MNNLIFKRPKEGYKTYLNPVQDYIKQSTNFIAAKHKISKEEAEELVKQVLRNSKELTGKTIKNPKIRFNVKNEVGDMEQAEVPLTKYIDSVKKDQDIIVPSFTVYSHPDKLRSLHADYLSTNIKLRSEDKHKAFKYEREGNTGMFLYYNTLQNSRKVKNNSLSGAYASPCTVLYNPSAHFTLTSITRCVSGIGNSLSEMLVGGNKYFKSPDTVISYISVVLSYVNFELVEKVISKYNLYLPTPKEVFDTIKSSSRWYWNSLRMENYIVHVLENLTPIQRAAVLYVNDLWNLKNFNDEFMRRFVGTLSKRVEEGSTNPLEDLNNEIDGVNVLAHHIYANDIRGKEVNYKELLEEGNDLVYKLASTAKNIKTTLHEYSDLLEAFYVTDILPINVAYLQDMVRYNIVLSDTDSTCCSYDKWVEWFFGSPRHDSEAIGVSASIMTLTTQLMDHHLKVFAKNMNTGIPKADYLQMKNEFYWSVFVTGNITKHYYASTLIKEGNVYKNPKLEKKGVHFISSTVGGDIVKKSEEMMNRIMDETIEGKKIDVVGLCKEIADIERTLIKDFFDGKNYMFKRDSIKGEKSYKQEADKSKFINHTFWMNVFSEQYGKPDNPPYIIYTMPLKVNNKTTWVEFLQEIEKKNPLMAQNMKIFCSKYNKEYIKTFRPPKVLIDAYGVPKELMEFIDIKKTVIQALRPFYYILETVGYYKKPDYLLSELNF